jgi:hypothetical protein
MLRSLLVVLCLFTLASPSFGQKAKPKPKKLSDAEISKLMMGKWENNFKLNNITINTVETFKKDGTLERVDTINGNQKVHIKATWEVKNGKLTTVVVEGFPGKGTKVSGKVISIDDKTQRLEMDAGADVTKTRLKE